MPAEPPSKANLDAVSNQGEFHARVPPSKPMMSGGHAEGVKVGNDAVPGFSAETLRAGTAPQDRSFAANAQSDVPAQEIDADEARKAFQSADVVSGRTAKSDVRNELGVGVADSNPIPGATSKDVHQGLGHPGSGQSSKELHGDGAYPGKRDRHGLAGVGGDRADSIKERGLDSDHQKGLNTDRY
ncbi:uncharacterized protein BP5553_00574 [Venustampulla echinocandica]|uniref:Uncharacterized protein n=1 Tax=Venustampulla echinocandica TaxID=2656787 RepID=A0A370TYJ0_9HELO|nr:uncharacterized protein BP5553_00574 [Venustampulla echinocandica]RDL40595.1 hypothetical protein BP5553_00574 [Venustampulla echinocandica]